MTTKFNYLILLFIVSGCSGMTSTFPVYNSKPTDINFYLINSDLIKNQKKEPNEDIAAAQLPIDEKKYIYTVKPSDILQITTSNILVSSNPVISTPIANLGELYSVDGDGSISVPFIGSVNVEGLTQKQIQDLLNKKAQQYIASPQLIVNIQEYRSQRVIVTGQVPKPGYLPITSVPISLLGALSEAGSLAEMRGLSDGRYIGSSTNTSNQLPEYPDLNNVKLTRGGLTYTYNVLELARSAQASSDPKLIDGDLIFVPAIKRSRIYLLGELTKSGLLEVQKDNNNLASALQTGGGLNQATANTSKVYVIRGESSKPTVFQLDASKPDAFALARQFHLNDEDIVFVGEANSAKFYRNLQQFQPGLQAILSAAVLVNTVNSLDK